MTKKTKTKKKLSVKKESLRKLDTVDSNDLDKVAGGLSVGCVPFKTWGCPTRPPEGGGGFGVLTYGC